MRTAIEWHSEKRGKETYLVGKVLNKDVKAIEEEIKNIPVDIPDLTSKLLDSYIELEGSHLEKVQEQVYGFFEKYLPSYKPVKDVPYQWKFDFYVDPDFVI